MEKIWFRSKQKRLLTVNVERLLKKWQLALKVYQDKTGDLGYFYTEKTNLGFLFWGCAQLKLPFLLEYTIERKYRGEGLAQGRPDGWIQLDKTIEVVIEAKRREDCLDTPPRKTIFKRMDLLRKELKSLRGESDEAIRVGLCFVILWRNKEKIQKKTTSDALSEYMDRLRMYPSIDFFAAYQSPEKIVNDPCNIDDDKWIYPAVLVIGKYV